KYAKKSSPFSFTLQINPENFSLTHTAVSGFPQRDATGDEINVAVSPSRKSLSLTFHLDSTGVVDMPKANKTKTVDDTVKLFLSVCTKVNGGIHKSNYLIIRWGSLGFRCRVESAQVDYTMFSPSGMPVRATITANFLEFIDEETEQKMENTNSPDLSHLVTIKEGDSLPALCHDIYGDSSYYIQVAALNGLSQFRSLSPGSRILFPRLEK
ncbi:hypothetical protein RZS08_06845, partial [Arthrospira platensis SPKY1]|nr:hypothetical protein [Arthrospira platensis SPKY1]